jgi:hypothetical protein
LALGHCSSKFSIFHYALSHFVHPKLNMTQDYPLRRVQFLHKGRETHHGWGCLLCGSEKSARCDINFSARSNVREYVYICSDVICMYERTTPRRDVWWRWRNLLYFFVSCPLRSTSRTCHARKGKREHKSTRDYCMV